MLHSLPFGAELIREHVTSSIVFVWDNFGPTHADRCEAVARHYRGNREIIGIEISERSKTYAWVSEIRDSFKKITLFQNTDITPVRLQRRIFVILRTCLRSQANIFFFCHYEHFATFVVASILRMLGKTVIVMNDSKFDDYQRSIWREFGKKIMHLPYWGGLAASRRSVDYMRFLGIRPNRIEINYDTLSIDRIRTLAAAPPAPSGFPFSERHFTIVARLVPKKNLSMALEAYSLYCGQVDKPRGLHICGAGPLEAELRRLVEAKGLQQLVVFHGFVQSDQVSRTLARSMALLLPSVEEQFGLVVIEALAMGVPVILTDQCGARDALVRSGVNGFIVEPDNPKGFAFFLRLLHNDQSLWRDMCINAAILAEAGDVAEFARAVSSLVEKAERP